MRDSESPHAAFGKRLTCLERWPDVPLAEFRSHWPGPRAAIACHLPGLVAYRQQHVVERTAL